MRNTLLFSHPGGWVCNYFCFECGCRSDQRSGCERSGGHYIAADPAQYAETWSRRGGPINAFANS